MPYPDTQAHSAGVPGVPTPKTGRSPTSNVTHAGPHQGGLWEEAYWLRSLFSRVPAGQGVWGGSPEAGSLPLPPLPQSMQVLPSVRPLGATPQAVTSSLSETLTQSWEEPAYTCSSLH